jgi:uncharacterized membrane protein YraQ (UPF0718 family)
MPEAISRELVYFWYYFSVQLRQVFWYWVLGMTLGSLVSVFGKEKIHRAFTALHGKKLGILGVFPASLLGIASPLCMYGTIPIAASFAVKGMRQDWIAAFMTASVLLNPQILFYSAALGLPVLVIRFTVCLLCGALAGICIRFLSADKPFFTFTNFEKATDGEPSGSGPSGLSINPHPVLRFLNSFGRNIKATGLYFLAGITLSALFQRFVPQEVFIRLFGSNRGFGILMAATVGVPLYVCGGGTIPLILAWMHNGMSTGAVTSFLIAGPAMKITNLGALKIVLGIKPFLYYILFIVVFAFFTGLSIDIFYQPPH